MLESIQNIDIELVNQRWLRFSQNVGHFVQDEIVDRNRKYVEFIQFWNRNRSVSEGNFLDLLGLQIIPR